MSTEPKVQKRVRRMPPPPVPPRRKQLGAAASPPVPTTVQTEPPTRPAAAVDAPTRPARPEQGNGAVTASCARTMSGKQRAARVKELLELKQNGVYASELLTEWLRAIPFNDQKEATSTFLSKGSVTISNFLQGSKAGQLYHFYTEEMPKPWWSLHVQSPSTPNAATDQLEKRYQQYDGCHLIENKHECLALLEKRWKETSRAVADETAMTFRFYRTSTHLPTCYCLHCQLQKVFADPSLLNLLASITRLPLTKFHGLYTSKFTKGCFASAHSNQKRGLLEFALFLNTKWLPHFGGGLHFTKPDNLQAIEETVVPLFNNLFLFALDPEKGRPRCVSILPHDIPSDLFMVTGWFG